MRMIDAQTFDTLFRGSYNKVKAYVRSLCHSNHDAEDITQEAFLRAYRSYHTFDSKSSFDIWVMAIARNQYFDFIRRGRCRVQSISAENMSTPFGQVADDAPSPEDLLMQSDIDPDLIDSLRDLEENQRRMLHWIIADGLTYTEVAQRLNIPLGTVKSRYNRLLNVVRANYRQTKQQTAFPSVSSRHAATA